jgi:hypothetical protein
MISGLNQVGCFVSQVHCRQTEAPCDQCHRSARRVWDTSRLAIDLCLEQVGLLQVTVSVHRCRFCRHYFRFQPAFLRKDAVYTNRVVATAIHSVFLDGMAITRVAARMARDFWVCPSEAMIRNWCRSYAQGLPFETDYQPWVVKSFSGILCVDEVYQGQLACLLAVDPAGVQGDRLVGYQLIHGSVCKEDVDRFLARLKQMGIAPQQVVTDGSLLYPSALATLWPQAAHQLCLFHDTRTVVKAVGQVIGQTLKETPKPPPDLPGKRIGRPRKDAPRELWIATVQRLRREGMKIRTIARAMGRSRNTVKAWLKLPLRPGQEEKARVVKDSPERPPWPWHSWEEVHQFRQQLQERKYLLMHRGDHLTSEEQKQIQELLAFPASVPLRAAQQFLSSWFNIFWTEDGKRQTIEEAKRRFQSLRELWIAPTLKPLLSIQKQMTEEHFQKLKPFLEHPEWESTNNGAERMGRQFRHLQANRFKLRTSQSIEDFLKVWAFSRMRSQERTEQKRAGHSNRGRKPVMRPNPFS